MSRSENAALERNINRDNHLNGRYKAKKADFPDFAKNAFF